jgi:hypothetical protein
MANRGARALAVKMAVCEGQPSPGHAASRSGQFATATAACQMGTEIVRRYSSTSSLSPTKSSHESFSSWRTCEIL